MIVGIDHVQFAVPDVQLAAAALGGVGYQEAFTQVGFESGAGQCPCFRERDKTMYFARASDGSVPVELISSAKPSRMDRHNSLVPIFRREIDPTAQDSLVTIPAGAFPPNPWDQCQSRYSKVLEGEYLLAAGLAGPVLSTMLVVTGQLASSLALWSEAIGFRIEAAGGTQDGHHLSWPETLVSRPLDLYLVSGRTNVPERLFVDDPGSVMLTLLSNNIQNDGSRLADFCPYQLGEIMEFNVNRKRVLASMHVGPGGELVELIQVTR